MGILLHVITLPLDNEICFLGLMREKIFDLIIAERTHKSVLKFE